MRYSNISDLYKQVQERKLTPNELEDREKIAKKLPMDDFKKRYGKDAMAVKMATATKMAKSEALELLIPNVLKKINQMTHPKQYDAIVKAYVKSRKDDPKKTPSLVLDKLLLK